MAERVGFEPTKGYKPLLVFKTSAFNRSATSPSSRMSATAHFARSKQQIQPDIGINSENGPLFPINH
jgi:hypothetical protein